MHVLAANATSLVLHMLLVPHYKPQVLRARQSVNLSLAPVVEYFLDNSDTNS